MFFGLWGAPCRFVGPILYEEIGVVWLVAGTGAVVAVIELFALVFMIDPAPAKPATDAPNTPDTLSDPILSLRQIMAIPSYWVFFICLLLFLAPGFGFKIIIQALSKDVFHASMMTASIMAVAFLATYGFSRLVFGILSDRIKLKLMYFFFSFVRAAALLIAAITLPNLHGVAFFTMLIWVSTSKQFESSGTRPRVSCHCVCPFTKRTYAKVPILFSADLLPSQLEQIADRSMSTQKPLSRLDRFKLTHSSALSP